MKRSGEPATTATTGLQSALAGLLPVLLAAPLGCGGASHAPPTKADSTHAEPHSDESGQHAEGNDHESHSGDSDSADLHGSGAQSAHSHDAEHGEPPTPHKDRAHGEATDDGHSDQATHGDSNPAHEADDHGGEGHHDTENHDAENHDGGHAAEEHSEAGHGEGVHGDGEHGGGAHGDGEHGETGHAAKGGHGGGHGSAPPEPKDIDLGEFAAPMPGIGQNVLGVHSLHNLMQIRFTMRIEPVKGAITQAIDRAERMRGALRHRVIGVCRITRAEDLAEPDLMTFKSKLLDALEPIFGRDQIARITVSDLRTAPL